jgi:hypothetical protein
VFAVPFKKKANAVFPALKLFGVDALLPDANTRPPTVSPTMNTATTPSINRRLVEAHVYYGSIGCS